MFEKEFRMMECSYKERELASKKMEAKARNEKAKARSEEVASTIALTTTQLKKFEYDSEIARIRA